MLLEELHDEGAALVQRSAERGVRHLVELQLPEDVLPVGPWVREEASGIVKGDGRPGLALRFTATPASTTHALVLYKLLQSRAAQSCANFTRYLPPLRLKLG